MPPSLCQDVSARLYHGGDADNGRYNCTGWCMRHHDVHDAIAAAMRCDERLCRVPCACCDRMHGSLHDDHNIDHCNGYTEPDLSARDLQRGMDSGASRSPRMLAVQARLPSVELPQVPLWTGQGGSAE